LKKREKERPHDLRIGFHTSIAGGVSRSVERAVELNCNTMQIFSHSPRQWAQTVIPDEEAKRFSELRKKYDIDPVFIHTSYLINLAAKTDDLLKRSTEFLSYELSNADNLGVEYVVLHTGSASGENEEKARKRATRSIVKALGRGKFSAKLLLENTAGERGDITSMIRSLAEIIELCGCDGIGGICVDTCHAFAAGYDLGKKEGVDLILNEIDKYIGLESLKLIHLNDSKKRLGSGVDRHEHIGEGYIGIKGFKNILSDKRVRSVPLILETPKKDDGDDKRNLKKVLDILPAV
jgi:deoxyribonuclease-4